MYRPGGRTTIRGWSGEAGAGPGGAVGTVSGRAGNGAGVSWGRLESGSSVALVVVTDWRSEGEVWAGASRP
jgi:hypothetical protein